jgi:hypothetical protein
LYRHLKAPAEFGALLHDRHLTALWLRRYRKTLRAVPEKRLDYDTMQAGRM